MMIQVTYNHLPEPLVASPQVPHPQESSPHHPHLQVTSPHLRPPQVTTHHHVPQPQEASPDLSHPQVTSPHLSHPQVTSPHLSHPQVTSPHLSHPQVTSFHLSHPQVTSPHLSHPQVTSPHLSHPQVTSPHLSHPQVTSPHFVPQPQVTSPHLHHSQVASPHFSHSQGTSPHLPSPQFTTHHLFQQPQVTSHQYVPQSHIASSCHLTRPQTTSPHLSHPHVTSPHFVPQPHVTSPHIVTQPQITSPHQNHFSSQNHNTGLDNPNWSRSEPSPELPCLLNSYSYSYQIQATAHLDLHVQNQNQFNTGVTHHREELENTQTLPYNSNMFRDGSMYGQGDTPDPGQNTWESLEPALSELQCSPLGPMSAGATLGKWSSMDFGSSTTEDFSNNQFFTDSYHDNNAPQSFCSPTTPGPSPHYAQTPTISSPNPQMNPRTERLSFPTQASMQLNISKHPSCCLRESNSYPVTSDLNQHHPLERSTCRLPSQTEPIQDQSCFSPQGKSQDVSSAKQPPGLPAGLNWKEESGGRGRRRQGGRGGGGDSQPDWTWTKRLPHENSTDRRLQCTVCERDFRSLPALNGHMRSHSGMRATCPKKGEDSSPPILPSNSMLMPVSVPVQPRGVSKACRSGQRRCNRLPQVTGGAVLYRSLMHLKEEEVVTSCNKAAASDDDDEAFNDGGKSHYTPPPMLCPLRAGPGLYCSLTTKNGLNEPVAMETLRTGINKPCINVGRGFQAQIPPLQDRKYMPSTSHNALLLWAPWDELERAVNQQRVEAVLRMARSTVMPGGGASPEHALHILSESRGDFLRTVEKLLSTPETSINHTGWTPAERRLLVKSLQLHHKDFSSIQKAVQTKSLSQCVEFYYLWKKKLTLTPKTGLTITLPNTNGRNSSQSHDAS